MTKRAKKGTFWTFYFLHHTHDESGNVGSIGDGDYDFDYTYSIFGNLTSTTEDLTGLTDDVVFSYT